MMTDQQLMIDRTSNTPVEIAQAPATTVKTILLQIQNDSSLDSRIEAALSLARACSAHVSCIHVRPVEAYLASDGFGGMNDVIKMLEEEDARLRFRIESRLKSEDVSWDYVQVGGDVATAVDVASTIVRHAALADLLVVGRAPQKDEFAAPATGLLGDLLFRARTPIFIPGGEVSAADPTGDALIAWDGSYEAANAVRSLLGLLKLAASVEVIQVPERKDDAFPGTRLLEYLSRHGIHAELVVAEPPSDKSDHDVVAATLVAHARATGAAYMVMGGYSHSRLGEYVFGGVTRVLLKECPVPLVIAH